ncbi:hypothetical protein COCMIDRAFT_90893, partial [Bipolaris oryzae ATCC 44560]
SIPQTHTITTYEHRARRSRSNMDLSARISIRITLHHTQALPPEGLDIRSKGRSGDQD